MKVFDGFMFYNEIDMALLRMRILADVVDFHVVVESHMTHSGQPKPLYFWEAFEAGMFDEFKDRIIYSCVNELEGDNSWAREAFHRAHIGKVLQYNAAPEDWVIVADCDEIPHPDALTAITTDDAYHAVSLPMDMYYYDFHHKLLMGWGVGMCKWRVEHDANKIRRGEFPSDVPVRLSDESLGWHLSYFLTPEGIVDKISSFMHHADIAANVPRDPVWIAERIAKGEDLFGRGLQIERVPLSDTLPRYVLKNVDKYAALGWLKPEPVTQHE